MSGISQDDRLNKCIGKVGCRTSRPVLRTDVEMIINDFCHINIYLYNNMSSIAGEAYLNFPASLDGLVNLDANNITINGVTITGNYLNSKSNTSDVNTVISLASGAQFTIKDTSNNELIKCDNATSFTNFYRPRTTFTGQNQADDIPNLLYGFNTYWFKSGSNDINGAFLMSSGGSIWFQTSTGATLLLMQGTGVQVNNPTLTNTINLYSLFNTYGGSNQLLMIDSSGNMQNAFNLTYVYGDANATILQTVSSNIGAQQQTIQFTRDFTINGLYGWKLSTATINKMPLDTDLPMTINNLYSNNVTSTTLTTFNLTSSNNLLVLSNSVNDSLTLDNGRIRMQGTGDWGVLFSPNRFNCNVQTGFQHSFSINDVQLFRFSNTASPTITSNTAYMGLFTTSGSNLQLNNNSSVLNSNGGGILTLNNRFEMIDSSGSKVYTNDSGLYTSHFSGGYSLMNDNAFLVSSYNSVLSLTNQASLSAGVGGNLSLNMGASLYSKTGFTCSLGVNNTNIISVSDDQHANDTLFFSRNTNDPNILFGTDITQNTVIGQSSTNFAFSTDASAGDLVIRNNNKNIRFGTNGGGDTNFIVNSNGSTTIKSRSNLVHQLTLTGNDFLGISTGSGISLNCGVNQSGNKQFWMMDPDLAFNTSNKIIRIMPGLGAIDCISSNVYLPLEILGSTFITNNTTTIKGTSSDRLSSLIVDTLRAGISFKSNLTGAVNWNFWSGGSAEAFGSAWYLYNETNPSFRFTVQAGGNIYLNAYTTNGTLSVTGSNGLISSSSDVRLKENINYITDTKKGLEQVLKLKPCEFNFIANKEHTQLGLIAQDVEQFIPISVDGKKYEYQAKKDFDNKIVYDEKGEVEYELDEEGNKKIRPRGLDYNAIVATQILAIQELFKIQEDNAIKQKQIIDEQKQHITTLQDNMSVMFKQMESMTNVINKLTEKINAM